MNILNKPDGSGPTNVSEVIAQVLVSEFSLNLEKVDAAFICAIHAHMDITRQPSIEEEELEGIFNQVAEAAMLDPTHRGSWAIQRLRKQGLIERADARGMASFGLYTLSSLANSLRNEIFLREKLTRRSLQVMMKRVIADLRQIRDAANQNGDQTFWDTEVVDQLRHLVAEVIRSIINRQKGLEAEQIILRDRIAKLLKSDGWQESITDCNFLLDTTSNTLQELHELLLQEMGSAQNLLIEIGEIAQQHEQAESFEMATRLLEQITSISAWSERFQDTWSEYYTRAQEFIRFSIRVDPNRKMSQRLRESIKSFADQPWALRGLTVEKFRLPRDDLDLPSQKQLAKVRVKSMREAEDLNELREKLRTTYIDSAKRQLEQDGQLVLSEFLLPHLDDLNEDDLFFVVGALHTWLMANAQLQPRLEHSWTRLRGEVEIQDIVAIKPKTKNKVRAKEMLE